MTWRTARRVLVYAGICLAALAIWAGAIALFYTLVGQ